MELEGLLYLMLAKKEDIIPKAIANFLFREIIEDTCIKYDIQEEDVVVMCQEAVNRAAVLTQIINDPYLIKALVLYGYSSHEWDSPEINEVDDKLQRFRETARSISDTITPELEDAYKKLLQ